ncbi:CHAP domain-containing protein [Leptolyngbya sp. GGD]|uniref:CHAP domain-containing protein n=1 Tax=Leptolyngbya sp. GGD TaxID=2997907 RepID=UPI00227B196C|nr:CHAP domain-containing protein [Leptolyngbya sp. GGD]MCY6494267.1 CHAP domain-containing protein [Leptolyngbya sp. GGD]
MKFKLSPKFIALASILSVLIPFSSVTAQANETFSLNGGKALNTNNNFRRIDGQPRMSIYQHNVNDPDQQFERLGGNRGGTLLRHRSTGKCLNAHRLFNGAEINVWNCDPNDPDQNFNIVSLGSNVVQIQRTGTRLCVDAPTRNDQGIVHLWECIGNVNQRFTSSRIASPSSGALHIGVDWNSPAYRNNNPFWRRFAPPSIGGTLNSFGNCTWYANGRLRQLGYRTTDLDRLLGNAKEWITQARNAGIPSGRTPQVGAIAQWVSGGGGFGHVAVVEQVNTNGTIVISESSYAPGGGFLYKTRTLSASQVENYIYVRG